MNESVKENKKAKWKLVFVVGGILVLLAAFFSPWAYKSFKDFRARALAEESQKLCEAGQVLEAYEKAKAAYFLKSDQPEAIRALARIFQRVDPHQSIPYWQELLKAERPASFEDHLHYAETALAAKKSDIVAQQLNILREMDAEDVDVVLLQVRYEVLLNQFDEAIKRVRTLVKQHPESDESQFLYVQLTQLSREVGLAQEGISHLLKLAHQKNVQGLKALRHLAHYDHLTIEQAKEVIRLIKAHPLVDLEDQLTRYRLVRQFSLLDDDELIKEVKGLFDLFVTDDLKRCCDWLYQNHFYAEVLRLIDRDKARTRKDLFLKRMDALAQIGEWNQVLEELSGTRIPLEGYLKFLFRMRAYRELGHKRKADLEWEKALLNAANSPEELQYMAHYMRKLGLRSYEREVYKRLCSNPITMRKAYEALIDIDRQDKKTMPLLQTYLNMQEKYPQDEALENDIVYLNLLLEQDVTSQRERARVLYEKNPNYLSHRMTYALALLKCDQVDEAFALVKALQLNWLQVPMRYRLILGAILRAKGADDLAVQAVQGILPEILLDKEIALLELSLGSAP